MADPIWRTQQLGRGLCYRRISWNKENSKLRIELTWIFSSEKSRRKRKLRHFDRIVESGTLLGVKSKTDLWVPEQMVMERDTVGSVSATPKHRIGVLTDQLPLFSIEASLICQIHLYMIQLSVELRHLNSNRNSGGSFIKVRNNRGPMIDPCATPISSSATLDFSFSTDTKFRLPHR